MYNKPSKKVWVNGVENFNICTQSLAKLVVAGVADIETGASVAKNKIPRPFALSL
jgi:hypothetical protein